MRCGNGFSSGGGKFKEISYLYRRFMRTNFANYRFMLQVRGFELNFVMKANERIVFKSFLASFAVYDISNTSIYSKVSPRRRFL